jgi:hypothetical protein
MTFGLYSEPDGVFNTFDPRGHDLQKGIGQLFGPQGSFRRRVHFAHKTWHFCKKTLLFIQSNK